MYVSFFGLRQAPFSIAPDPRYLFMSERHREALAHLLYGLGGGGGFVLLTGEVGAGKTTVCRCFLEQVPADCHVAYIFNPKLTVTELLQTVADEFHIPGPAGGPAHATVKDYIDPLNAFLLRAHAARQSCVLVIDEAQNLSADVLEQLRLLTNLETHERKLLQIVLIGQPELRTLLARPELAQLAQRVIARYHLGALSEADTGAYIAHRLAVAGLRGAMPFDRAALRRIHRLAGGVPRRINLLADRALLGSYAQGRAQVGARTVSKAAAEVFDTGAPGRSSGSSSRAWLAAAWAAGAAVALAALAVVAWERSGTGSDGATSAVPPSGVAAGPASSGAVPQSVGAPRPAASATAAVAGDDRRAAMAVSAAAPGQAGSPAAPADGPAAVTLAPGLSLDLASFPRDERAALNELLPLWQLPPSDGDPCRAAQAAQTPCFRTTGATVALLRTLDRPGLLLLRDGAGHTVHARLAGLGPRHAVLAAGRNAWRVPLEDLAGLWRGDFVTLWRAPPGYQAGLSHDARGPAVDFLARGLVRLRNEAPPPEGQAFDDALARRLSGFQMAWGLKPDGIAGPTTFMQLNRATGIAEPALTPER